MSEKVNLKKRVLSGLLWKFMERIGMQGINFIVQIILARILLPEDYGVIALITIFIVIADVFVHSGLTSALIQKKEADELDFSSVFYLSLFISILLYIVLFIAAPIIAVFYSEPQLIPVLRILSLTLFFGVLNSVQGAVVSRTMQFKRFFYSSLGGIIASGIIGISMAYMGYGVWALVWQQLSSNFFISIVLWFTVKWRPKLMFSPSRLKDLFTFGWKLLISSLIDTIYNNIYGLVIGRVYSSEMLAYYKKGGQFPHIIVSNVNGSILSVLFPALSSVQGDRKRMKAMVRRSIVTSSFLIFPAMSGLIVCAELIIKIILTDKWLPAVPFMQIICISYALWPIHTVNLQAINALGRSDIFLKLELIKKIIGVSVLCISIKYGIYVMVGVETASGFIAAIINSYPNRYLLDYSLKEQVQDIFPSLILSVVMGTIVYLIKFINLNIFITLFIKILVGVVIYFGMAYMFKLECMTFLLDTIKSLIENRSKGVQENG